MKPCNSPHEPPRHAVLLEAVTNFFATPRACKPCWILKRLARAESSTGVIPSSAALAIAAKCRAELFDRKIARGCRSGRESAIPLVQAAERPGRRTTTKTPLILCTGARPVRTPSTPESVLQLRERSALIDAELKQLCAALAKLADAHRATPIVGRTWMQQAVPTTLGMKFAGWLDALFAIATSRSKLNNVVSCCNSAAPSVLSRRWALTAKRSPKISAAELKLPLPQISWHSHRDRIGEIATTLGLLTGTLGKIARDISLHSQTEIAELREPARQAAAALPPCRTSATPSLAPSLSQRRYAFPVLVSTMLCAMVQEDERGARRLARRMGNPAGNWSASLAALCTTSPSCCPAWNDAARMRENLEITQRPYFRRSHHCSRLSEKIESLPPLTSSLRGLPSNGESVTKNLAAKFVLPKIRKSTNHLSTLSPSRQTLRSCRNYLGQRRANIETVLSAVIQQPRSDTHSDVTG